MSANVGFDQAFVLVRDRAVSTRIVLVTDCDPAPAAVKGLRKRLQEEWRSAAAAVDVVPVPRSSGPSAAFWLSRLAHAAVCPRDWHPDLYAVQPFLGWTFESVVRETNAEVILISVISPRGNGGPLDGGQELVYASLPGRVHLLANFSGNLLATAFPPLPQLRRVVCEPFPGDNPLGDNRALLQIFRAIQTGELCSNTHARPRLGPPFKPSPCAGTTILAVDEFGYVTLSLRWSAVAASPGNFFNVRVGSKDLARVPLRCRPHASDVRIALLPHGDCDDDPWVDLWLHPKHVFPDVCANVKPGDPVTITPAA